MSKKVSLDFWGIGIVIGVTTLAGMLLTLSNTNAVVDRINITVPESCTVEGTIEPGEDHTKTMQNGQYATGIGTTTFKTYCNDNGGYAIYAVGYSADTIGNTLMKHNTSSTYDFNTGTATSGNTSNWAMKLTAVTGTYAPTIHSDANGSFASQNYHVVPNEYTKVVSFPSNTDLPANASGVVGSGFTSTYAVWVSTTQVAGTYTGKVKYTLVHPATEIPLFPQITEAGCISYYPNGSNVEGTMGCQPVTDSDTSTTLLASNFSRQGYGFAGWSKTYDYSDSTGFLGPQEDITFTAGQYTGSNNGLSLYARWVKSVGSIQGWTGCANLASGAVTALTDQRDGETYAVAKLADGNCWMIENLRLENIAEHNSDGTLAQGYDASFVGLASPEVASLFTDIATANTLYSTDGSTNITISGSFQGYRIPRFNNINTPSNATDRPTNPTTNSATNSTSNASMYSYGNYYTWAAAIADTSDYSSDDHNTTSICPTGWRIPTGNFDNEYYALNIAVNNSSQSSAAASKGFRAYPNNFIYSGYIINGSVGGRGSSGRYQSSTTVNNYDSFYLSVNPSSLLSTVSYHKYYGWAIRCVTSGA